MRHSVGKRQKGFTLIEVMIVVLIIGMLMGVAVPNFITARETARRKSCLANLKQLFQAKEQYALDNNIPDGTVINMADIIPVYIKVEPACPGGGAYNLLSTGDTVDCTIPGHDLP